MTDSGLEMPPDQNASQTRSTCDLMAPVSKGGTPCEGMRRYGIWLLQDDGNAAAARRQRPGLSESVRADVPLLRLGRPWRTRDGPIASRCPVLATAAW